ncbi:DUF2862 domain-containing protein [Acaryochloris sp. IP29b_bin.137]|uniref:cytochrome b6f subunit PetP n=1 Tax=Acaryochloris sp. IP29b_bin.137 TaxID=2969217 RepID=UPI00262ACF8F|nr:DUF2862 domain-containing protein [Acaryochloris sp. IP29b_bin.137]
MKLGQKVRVCQIRDRFSGTLSDKLGEMGTIQEFKMTDGSGVGAVVVFNDKTSSWFFEDELETGRR